MAKQVQLRNDFHNTKTYVLATDGEITRSQAMRARRKLCGIGGCACGGPCGERPIRSEYVTSDRILIDPDL